MTLVGLPWLTLVAMATKFVEFLQKLASTWLTKVYEMGSDFSLT